MKKIIKNIHYIIIMLVAVILLVYGLIYHINKINYNKNAIITSAKIYQLSNNNGIKTLYLKYVINNKNYNSVLSTKDKNIKMGTKIKIYCDRKNPKFCTDGKISNYGLCLIILGTIILIIDILMYLKNKLK